MKQNVKDKTLALLHSIYEMCNQYYFIFIFLFFLLLGISKEINFILLCCCVLLLFIVKYDIFLCLYLVLDVFSEVMSSAGIYTYFLRIYQVIFIVRTMILVYQKRDIVCNFSKKVFLKNNFIIILLLLGLLLYERNLSTIFSFLIFHFPIIVIIGLKCNKDTFKTMFFKFFSLLGLIMILYSISHRGFGLFTYGNIAYDLTRWSFVTYNPNISAYYLLLSLICLFYDYRSYQRKWIIPLLIICYSVAILATVSISTIILLFIFYSYFLLSNKYIKTRYYLIIILASIIVFFIAPINFLEPFRNRVIEIIAPFISSKYAPEDSSGIARFTIYSAYLKEFNLLPTINKILGGIDITKGTFLEYIKSKYGVFNSHSFLIDMLYGGGIAYVSVFLSTMVINLKKLFKINEFNVVFFLKVAVIAIGLLTKIYPTILFYLILSNDANSVHKVLPKHISDSN